MRLAQALFGVSLGLAGVSFGAVARIDTPYVDAAPILADLQPALWPAEFRDQPSDVVRREWSGWVKRRDQTIRQRLAEGDEQTVINFLLYGTSFTKQPRTTARQVARLAGSATRDQIVRGRIDDLAEGVAHPGSNERLEFARTMFLRKGVQPDTATGRDGIRRLLRDGLTRLAGELDAAARIQQRTKDDAAAAVDAATVFRERGLSADTTFQPNFGLQQALTAIRDQKLLAPRSVRRVVIVGPGLDFTDKLDGFDFYPVQSIQPYAILDALRRVGLAAPSLAVTTLDLSPAVNRHIAAVRARAARGRPYVLNIPLDADLPWAPAVIEYWKRFGDLIGRTTTTAGPVEAGDVVVRQVEVRPDVAAAVSAEDVNVVLQRLHLPTVQDRVDLVVATDVLLYYDVFEQSLALVNIARMLRRGGVFLTNGAPFVVPAIPLTPAGSKDVTYLMFENPSGDRFSWFLAAR